MFDIPIIDAHLHLWDTNNLSYPWLKNYPILNRPFLLPDYEKDSASYDIEGMIFIQCEADVSQAMDEARWVAGLAEENHKIRAIIPWAPLEKGEDSRPFLQELSRIPLVKGVRRIIQYEEDPDFCIQPAFVRGVKGLADFDLSFDICISHRHLANTIRMVEQCPQVRFVLDHIGKPDIKNRLFHPWMEELDRLARFSNVYCKISGLITEADNNKWLKEDLKPYLDQVIKCFGIDRVLFGGDWPMVNLAGDFSRWLNALQWALSGCSRAELKRIFRDNAVRFYKLNKNNRLRL
ncbi:MAG: amidohydrolase family protein [Spirochaetota bacterium]